MVGGVGAVGELLPPPQLSATRLSMASTHARADPAASTYRIGHTSALPYARAEDVVNRIMNTLGCSTFQGTPTGRWWFCKIPWALPPVRVRLPPPARDSRWAALRSMCEMERSEERKLVDTLDARLLVPTEFSPLR